MKSIIQFFFFVAISQSLYSQETVEKYARVKIDLTTTELSTVSKLGLETDHGDYIKGRHLINDFSEKEMVLLATNNISFEVLIDDVSKYYANQIGESISQKSGNSANSGAGCSENGGTISYDYKTPENYVYGSMGGYLTYDELHVELEKMVTKYPNLITSVAPIGDIKTHNDLPIEWLRVSDNANMDEDEPEVLYTALHHAREPNSLSQMVFYLWYLLENYETDTEIKYLVDNTQMYFIPVVNPDGYIYNEETNPDGGGLWRKNRYSVEDIVFGVDLNRNYGYEWAHDDNGSSPNQESATYRGESGFSEPETQAVREFCNLHDFRLALNYHTYGNLLIYPWGYSNAVTEDHQTFRAFADVMTKENIYFAGTGIETVEYTVNGNSDDWMYGETTSKPSIFSMTPEVGDRNLGFWPPQSEIDRLNKSALLQNLMTAHLLLNYAELHSIDNEDEISTMSGALNFQLKKYGLLEGDLTVRVSNITENINFPDDEEIVVSPEHLEEIAVPKSYMLSDDIANGDIIKALLEVDNGKFICNDTLELQFNNTAFENVFTDAGDDIDSWTVIGGWAETEEDYVSAPSSITDSPQEEYGSDAEVIIALNGPLSLEGATAAKLNFFAKWDIEDNYDYVQILASTDGIDYTPLCGKYTNLGTENQDDGQPLYDGLQEDWVNESMDLSDFIGEVIYLRFRLVSDGFVSGDGFYFDDLTISVSDGDATNVIDLTGAIVETKILPNPTTGKSTVEFQLTESLKNVSYQLYNAVGQLVEQKELLTMAAGLHRINVDSRKLEKGIYFIKLNSGNQNLVTERMVRL